MPCHQQLLRRTLKITFAVIFLLAPVFVSAQNPQIDSLKRTMRTVADTQKVINCIKISSLYNRVNADSCHHYADSSLNMAVRLKNPVLVARAKLQYGSFYNNTSQYDKATTVVMSALKVFDSIKDYSNAASAANTLGNSSMGSEYTSEAMKWYRSSLDYAQKANNEYKVAIALFGLANVEFEMKIFDSSAVHFERCEIIFLKLDRKREAVSASMVRAQIAFKLGKYEESFDILTASRREVQALGDNYLLGNWYMSRGKAEVKLNRIVPGMADMHTALYLFRTIDSHEDISTCYEELAAMHHFLNHDDSAYFYSLKHFKLNDSLFTEEKMANMKEIETQYRTAEKDKENSILSAAAKEQETRQVYFIIALGVMVVIVLLGIWGYRLKQRDNKIIAEAKRKSDELLLNILPFETAEELKQSGSAKARSFDMVTVMFTDFKGFTSISERLTAEQLVGEINTYFVEFDNIIQRHGIEKIKTIGDAYMAVGGLPTPTNTHAEDVVNAALEIQLFAREMKVKLGDAAFEVRIGIHTGPVVAGIVGIRKFAYDIWGDTVNIASRMESACVNGAINVSATTHALVKDKFKSIPRGKIDVKGKGELEMYFIVPEKTEMVMDFVRAKDYMVDQLRTGLSPQYYYHSVGHTLDVLKAVDILIKEEGLTNSEQIDLLRTAAVFHDAGFLRRYDQNEIEAAKMAGDLLPRYGYSQTQIEIVQRCIMVTVLGCIPGDKLEAIMKDADFDYLGRDDYWDISIMLRKEWESVGIKKTDEEWFALQVSFLSNHEYHTDAAKRLRGPVKQAHVEILTKLHAKLKAKSV